MDTSGEVTMNAPAGTLAGEDAAARKRAEIRKKLDEQQPIKLKPGGNAMDTSGEVTMNAPAGTLAGEDAAARKRAEIRKLLDEQQPIKLKAGGNAMDTSGEVTMNAPTGTLAGEDAASKKRRELRERLLKGDTVPLGQGGAAMNGGENVIEVAKGKLAGQWYDNNPTLLAMEKIAMERNFPQFKLDKLDDGRLCWIGVIEPGIYESKFGVKRQYHLMAVYDNNHPHQQMGSSVRVYPLMPDVDELIQMAGFRPYHLLQDSVGNLYLCTNEAGDQKTGTTTTTAASVLGWATKWLVAFELVLTGDLPLEKFNAHGGI